MFLLVLLTILSASGILLLTMDGTGGEIAKCRLDAVATALDATTSPEPSVLASVIESPASWQGSWTTPKSQRPVVSDMSATFLELEMGRVDAIPLITQVVEHPALRDRAVE